jgi:hypothetical protein
MTDSIKESLVFVVGILVFFGLMFAASIISNSLIHECRLKAIEKGMNASEIQVVCRS